MKEILYRIGNLELRKTENVVTKKEYIEIVRWEEDDNYGIYCYTIIIFEENNEGYYLKSVGNRMLLEADEEWDDLGILITAGFDFLNKGEEMGYE